jgi:hypothetical protein
MHSLICYALNATDRDASLAKRSLAAAALSSVVAAALVYQFGILGACWSTVMRPALQIAVLLPSAIRVLSITAYRGAHGISAPLPSLPAS